ncbi:Ciliary neurotrophic factor [Aix galericulata]|nr:Ciliary neurotrophic factor [Aix galericulata]
MAAADTPSASTLRRRDLCSRGIRLARKMRSDVADLLDIYVSSSPPAPRGCCRRDGGTGPSCGTKRCRRLGLGVSAVERQGLDASVSVAAVEGVPAAAAEHWSEQTGTQRLLDNLAAYRAFRALLAQMLEEQREQLGDADAALGRALAAVLLQVSAFAYHLEELLELESRGPPGDDGDGPPAPPPLSLFEQKLRGLGVLRELAQWAVRSVRDLRQLARPGPGPSSAPGMAEGQ